MRVPPLCLSVWTAEVLALFHFLSVDLDRLFFLIEKH